MVTHLSTPSLWRKGVGEPILRAPEIGRCHVAQRTHRTSTRRVPFRKPQKAIRHSDIKLTMNNYTDPQLLDVAGAVEALPTLLIVDRRIDDQATRMQATGTDGGRSSVAPTAVPTRAKACQKQSMNDSFENGKAVAKKTQKPLDSQGKPRVVASRDDRTPIELFLAGTRALALHSPVIHTLQPRCNQVE